MRTLAALLLVSAPAFAAGLASRSASEEQQGAPMEGLYLAGGGGGQLLIIGSDNAFGYDIEGRLGYSFNPGTQIYLAGSLDSANFSTGSKQNIQIVAFLQYHLITRGRVLVYTRVGIGLGLEPNITTSQTGLGIAEAGGLGIEIRMGESFFLAPELFYRRATVSAASRSDDLNSIGLQLALIYY